MEDEAHRLDRIQTQQLNRRAEARLRDTARSAGPVLPDRVERGGPGQTSAEVALQRKADAAIAAWRRDNQACPPSRRKC